MDVLPANRYLFIKWGLLVAMRDVKDTFLLKVFTSVRVAMVKREKPQIAMFWAECYWGD